MNFCIPGKCCFLWKLSACTGIAETVWKWLEKEMNEKKRIPALLINIIFNKTLCLCKMEDIKKLWERGLWVIRQREREWRRLLILWFLGSLRACKRKLFFGLSFNLFSHSYGLPHWLCQLAMTERNVIVCIISSLQTVIDSAVI